MERDYTQDRRIHRSRRWGMAAGFLALAGAAAAAPPSAPAGTPTAPVFEEDASCVGRPGTAHVHVTVENLRSAEGQVTLTLYADDSRKFLRRKGSLYVRRVPARAPSTPICFLIPQPGTYAVAIYHDANANGKIDRGGFLGLPTEGFGFSNNASTLFGLPMFSSVRIRLTEGSTMKIRLRYLRPGELPLQHSER